MAEYDEELIIIDETVQPGTKVICINPINWIEKDKIYTIKNIFNRLK